MPPSPFSQSPIILALRLPDPIGVVRLVVEHQDVPLAGDLHQHAVNECGVALDIGGSRHRPTAILVGIVCEYAQLALRDTRLEDRRRNIFLSNDVIVPATTKLSRIGVALPVLVGDRGLFLAELRLGPDLGPQRHLGTRVSANLGPPRPRGAARRPCPPFVPLPWLRL